MSVRPGTSIAWLAFLLASVAMPAQSDKPGSDNLLARVSYQSTYMGNWSDQQSPRICFALYSSGRYQLLKFASGTNEAFEGTLSHDELDSISRMLNNLDPGKSNKGGMIRKGSELLVAELLRKDGTEHYAWIDPDHQRPFPTSADSIVNWLQNFKPQGASALRLHEMGEFSICPPPSATPVPAIASEIGARSDSSCDATAR